MEKRTSRNSAGVVAFVAQALSVLLLSVTTGARSEVFLHDDLQPGFSIAEPGYAVGLIASLYREKRSFPIVVVNGRLKEVDSSPRAGAYIRTTSSGDLVCLIAIDPSWAASIRARMRWPTFDRFAIDHEIHHCTAFFEAGMRSDPAPSSATLSAELGADIFALIRAIASHQWSTVDKIIELRQSMADGTAHDTGEILAGLAEHLTAADLEELGEVDMVNFANQIRDRVLPGVERVGCLKEAGVNRAALQVIEHELQAQATAINALEVRVSANDDDVSYRLNIARQGYQKTADEIARLRQQIGSCRQKIRLEARNYRNFITSIEAN